jgi:hypothetical protein
MQINFLCPACSRENVLVTGEPWRDFRCEHDGCRREIDLELSASILERNVVDTCVVCRKDLFFLQKDFNRTLGCAILVLGAVTSVLTYGLSLLVAAAVDWILYYRLREVTVCYFCNSIYRGAAPNPKHKGYDLSIGELVEGSIRGES